MSVPHKPNQNHLLTALPEADIKRLSPHLHRVPMSLGESYYESDRELQHVYFPTTAIVSLLHVMESGAPAEIAGVGHEGMLGIPLFREGNVTPCLAFVRTAGYGYRLKTKLLVEEFNRAGVMKRLLLRYTHTLITQTSQTAVCNRQHPVVQRLCRWLLLALDRRSSNELILKQELIASLFGVGREGVMEAVMELQQAGLIRYSYGSDCLTVLDRLGLEERVCECYRVVKNEFDRLLGLDWDWRPMPESVKTWSRASAIMGVQI